MPSTAGLGWKNCPAVVTVKEDLANIPVTEDSEDEPDLILEGQFSRGSFLFVAGAVSASAIAYWSI